uniref:ATP-dependent Clp protease proteolytic subunit 1 n=1 Tax=Halophila ovalis TaxID=62339 RepID=UPI00226CA4C7|nr:ATP-dependent Clp protease proteolytic subunit 1 [Halophila ovalis]UZH94384.1 ATP-dependent Clp protease proteolytic subunit 1 [Halophila ovalis]
MPVGLPKVPFRIPGDEDASWVDLYNRLYRKRILFLGDEIDEELGNTIVGIITYLSIEDENPDIFLFINSPGGEVLPGLAIYDSVSNSPPDVNTICMGTAASMACLILTGGAITKRIAFANGRVLMHQPYIDIPLLEEIMPPSFYVNEILEIRDRIILSYAQRTKQPEVVICLDIQRDVLMSAEEAKRYGIIDSISLDEIKGLAPFLPSS